MRYIRSFLTGLFVLLPLIISVLVPLAPVPEDLSIARRNASAASFSADTITEMEALQTELSYAPWQGEKWQRLGRLALDFGKNEESIEAFNQAKEQGQLSTEGKIWLADALIANGDTENAKGLLREFSSLNQVEPFIYLQAAMQQRSLHDTYGALATLLKAYEISPLNGEINFQIGLLLSATEPEKALPYLERAGELNPDRMSLCQDLTGMIEESAAAGETAERYLYLGQVLSSYDEWDAAQLAFQKATNLEAQNGVAWALLAEAAQQNNQDGQEFILKAQELAPGEEMVNGLSALYYRRQNKTELALVYLQNALAANPKALVWEIETGNTLSQMGDLASALKHYQAAVEIDPLDWTPWRALAAFCITRNYEMETGLSAARQALKLNDQSPALMDLLGTALLMTNDLDEAEYYFLAADKIDPHQSAILIHLGQLYLAKGEKEQAVDYLHQAVEYAQDDRLQEMAERILTDNGEE